MPLHATFRAKEDVTVYVIARRHFSSCFNRKGRRFHDYCKLLEEVQVLTPLLSSERWELACNSSGLVEFQPGERVLHQGRVRTARQWYVIFSGSAVVSLDQNLQDGQQENVQLAHLSRAGHFGERSLLRGDAAAPVNVDAGPEGMCCLTFHGENIRVLLEKVLRQAEGLAPTPYCDIKEWWSRKARGFDTGAGYKDLSHKELPTNWDRCVSGCEVKLTSLNKICFLGRGGYGQVNLVEDGPQGQRYALKALSKGHILKHGLARMVNWERELLTMVDSPFMIRLTRTFQDAQHVYFLLEAALGGSLVQVFRDHPEIFIQDNPRGATVAFYTACVTAALEHLHERNIVHRDVKAENVLLDERGYAKVCDMGFARFVLGKTNTLAGTPDYMAPEMIDFPHTHTRMVDWWALGVFTYELLAGQTPFTDEGISDSMGRLLAIRRSQEQPLTYPFHFPHAAKGLVAQLLHHRPQFRLGAGGANDVRTNVFFRTVNFDFDSFHAQTLPTPFHKPWSDRDHMVVDGSTDDFGMDRDGGQLGIDPSNSIFVDGSDADAALLEKF